jgi:hypothetical protein
MLPARFCELALANTKEKLQIGDSFLDTDRR